MNEMNKTKPCLIHCSDNLVWEAGSFYEITRKTSEIVGNFEKMEKK